MLRINFTTILLACFIAAACGSKHQEAPAAGQPGGATAQSPAGDHPQVQGAANAAAQVNGTEHNSQQAQAIGNGRDEVGLLFQIGSDNFVAESCTGTLVQTAGHHATNIVLTAKHCENLNAFYLGNGQALAYPSDHDWAKAARGMTAYRVVDSAVIDNGSVAEGTCPHAALDLRLLRLDRNVEGVAPALIAEAPPLAGVACNFVGFGAHADPATGQEVQLLKRGFSVSLSSMTAASLEQTKADHGVPGSGDSGGPLFCNQRLVGTDSCGFTLNGFNDLNQSYARVDAAAAWIDATIAAWQNSNNLSQAN